MKLNLLSQYRVEKSTDNNQSQLLNMYLEESQAVQIESNLKGEYDLIAYSFPGLPVFCDTTESSIRALYKKNNLVYVVAGNHFYSIDSAGTRTLLGTLNTNSGFAKIKAITGGGDSNNQLQIIDGTNGYSYNIGTGTATFPISDADFPQTAVDLTTQDDYSIYLKANSMVFGLSSISDTTSYNALDFGSKFRQPDLVAGIIDYHGELWVMGTETIEIWNNTGNNDFQFERRSDVLIEIGLAAKESAIIVANTLFLLGQSATGGYGFIKFVSTEPENIASKAIMTLLSTLTTISDCRSLSFAMSGNEFILWTFPSDNITICYNVTNHTWTTRQSYINGVYGQFLGNCACLAFNKQLIGDQYSGKIYYASPIVHTENSVSVKKQFTSAPVYSEGKLIYISRLQIDVQTNVGTNKTFTLEMSVDRGTSWETIDTYTIPISGLETVYTTSLGSARCFLFRITCLDDCFFALLGFQAELSIGVH